MNFSLLPTAYGGFNLMLAPHAGMSIVTEVAARLALAAPLRVLDCGNRFNVYPLAKTMRRLTIEIDPAMEHVLLSRAFTCYQVLVMLKREVSHNPVLVVDLLATFLDEDVSLVESQRLLSLCVAELQRLSRLAPVLVTVKPLLALSAERAPLLETIVQSAGRFYRFEESSVSANRQGALWSTDQF